MLLPLLLLLLLPPGLPLAPPLPRRSLLLRRSFLSAPALRPLAFLPEFLPPPPASAGVGPVKVPLSVLSYSAVVCPAEKPIPGEKAMKGMLGMCVTVKASVDAPPSKPLSKVGVYGFVTDAVTSESVLANNPDLSTDAGQFTIIEDVAVTDREVTFEFIAAVPKTVDVASYAKGIQDLAFKSLRLVSYPGGQQYGEVSPCEMNEFSSECEQWEERNGEYKKEAFMMDSNKRTKGR
jgi:hypothetical protein